MVWAATLALSLFASQEGPWRRYQLDPIVSETDSVYSIERRLSEVGQASQRFWLKIDHARDRTVKQRSSQYLVVIDCQAGRYTTLASYEYDAVGTPLSTFETEEHRAQRHYLIPGSIMESFSKGLCPEK